MEFQFIIFTSKTCAPCRIYKPIVNTVLSEFNDHELISVDVDNNPEMAQGYGIRTVPSVVIKVGSSTHKLIGPMGSDDLRIHMKEIGL